LIEPVIVIPDDCTLIPESTHLRFPPSGVAVIAEKRSPHGAVRLQFEVAVPVDEIHVE
jgi:hypothetical protein